MPNEKIKKCAECSKDFLIIAAEEVFYRKKDLPLPDRCPDCRRKYRLALKNPRKLYRRDCGKCGKEIITTYPPETPYSIYCQKCYWQEMQ